MIRTNCQYRLKVTRAINKKKLFFAQLEILLLVWSSKHGHQSEVVNDMKFDS